MGLVACVMAGGTIAAQGGLTADERKLVTVVDKNNDDALKLLERVVNINSGTQNFAGVREVGSIFVRSSTRSASRPNGSTARRGSAPGTWWPNIRRRARSSC